MNFENKWLFEAINRHKYKCIQRAIEKKPSIVNTVWKEQLGKSDKEIIHPAFFVALFERHQGIIDAFLKVPLLDKTMKGYDQKNAVSYMAFDDSDLPIIKKLVNNGFSFDESDYYGRTPAMTCVLSKRGHKTFEYLLHQGANLYQKDWEGNTLLHLAAQQKDPYFIKCIENFILKKQALDLYKIYNAQNKEGRTAVHEAIISKNYQIARQLAKKLSKIDFIDKQGKCLLGDNIEARSAYHSIVSEIEEHHLKKISYQNSVVSSGLFRENSLSR